MRHSPLANRVEQLLRALGDSPPQPLSMAKRNRDELGRYLHGHLQALRLHGDTTNPNDALQRTRFIELENAVRFVESAFIRPRTFGNERQILEAADWLCVEGFQAFLQHHAATATTPATSPELRIPGDSFGGNLTEPHPTSPLHEKLPVGPVVAVAPSDTPAVWAPNSTLPIPSLFFPPPKGTAGGQNVAPFSLICLPNSLALSPEYFPLLSHEVGHCVDWALDISQAILAEIPSSPLKDYWQAWMREIAADAFGLSLSGEAFVYGLIEFLERYTPYDTMSIGSAYPPDALRLIALKCYFADHTWNWHNPETRIPSSYDQRQRELFRGLQAEFLTTIAPLIRKYILTPGPNWSQESQHARQLATGLNQGQTAQELQNDFTGRFSVLVSAVAMSRFQTESESTTKSSFEILREFHQSVPEHRRPEWIAAPSEWKFSEEYLPTLRPTLLGSDGRIKVPPGVLLQTHAKIAFVGSTNWQLLDGLRGAFERRNRQPWQQLDIYFASDDLLEFVVHQGPPGTASDPQWIGDQLETASEIKRRLKRDAMAKLQKFLESELVARNWSLREFAGPAVFASYWDWDEPGGRIHISPALLGTPIGECPAQDHIWLHHLPTDAYQKYRRHLEQLFQDSRLVANCSNEAKWESLGGTFESKE